ncbi:MAG: DUF2628 domain-containing protein [Alphaproteobacteria bacterium]|nr:DUF2628 domain-containing protein [Alphaproteobacteria bacterium]
MFNSIQLYEIYQHPNKPEEEATVLVRQGFSIFAFLFHGAWLLYQRLWLEAILFTVLLVASVMVGQKLGWSEVSIGIIQLALQCWLAANASEIRGAALERRGFILRDVSTGSNVLDAERRYYYSHEHA